MEVFPLPLPLEAGIVGLMTEEKQVLSQLVVVMMVYGVPL
jgi:hypothetical protein